MARPVIALLTDFGTRDHYAGAMRGVVLGICPEATLADITHDIGPQDVLGGAIELAAAFRFFPTGTVFLAVVDPGVGSARRAIAAAAGDYTFVAPDNGLLTVVFQETPPAQIVELTERQYALPTVSRTFEGRDRFAPAAAWLAKGLNLRDLGAPLDSWQRLVIPEPAIEGDQLGGEVLHVDRFGNLVTNITRRQLESFAGGQVIRVAIGQRRIEGVVGSYSEVGTGSTCALYGSSDRLEIAVNGGSAADQLGLGRGGPVLVTR